jgi:hypothetical protein
MADSDIVQNMIVQLGQSQAERVASELDVHFADVDERTTEDLLHWIRAFAALVNYYTSLVTLPNAWTPIFPDTGTSLDDYVAGSAGRVPAHLALFLAFLELYKTPQGIINDFTGRHLDFYYQEVLRLEKRAAVPDHAFLLVELKKGALPVPIRPEHIFSAGKDATGVELLYAPVRESMIGPAQVTSLRSIYVDQTGHGAVRFAPIANSSDGLGGKLSTDGEPKWRGFGYPELAKAEIGFAVASPVLRMSEGERAVKLRVHLGGVNSARLGTAVMAGAFSVFLTGEKSWIEPESLTTMLGSDDVLELDFTLHATSPAVVDYQQAVHGYTYAASSPIVQVLLNTDSTTVGYLDFQGVVANSASVSVEVTNVASLTLESDAGALDPKKAFQPFGSQPTAGARFMVSYPEALSKKLSELKLSVQWKDAPSDLGDWYSTYDISGTSNAHFTANVGFKDAAGIDFSDSSFGLFNSSNASSEIDLTFSPGGAVTSSPAGQGRQIYALKETRSSWGTREAQKTAMRVPVRASYLREAPAIREGFVTITLKASFLHAEYRKKNIENLLAFTKVTDGSPPIVLNEPYTPTIQSISLSYKAYSDDVAISSTSLADFANPDVQFFQVTPFGPMREHGYERQKLGFLSGTDVSFLPVFEYAGELLIGLSKLAPGDGVTLLFQVAAGSADPELPQENIAWLVLCDDHWKPLDADELVLDTTNHMLASGIVKITVPTAATTQNTVLPSDLIWIKAAVPSNVEAVSQLIDVEANAVEVALVDQGNDPAHLQTALPAKKIAKLKNGLAAVKGVTQPYASFGASPAEQSGAFNTRVSERLRHKDRCVTAWDYERVVLQAFQSVHRVKCIPHAKPSSWMAPGNVLLVVVPDLRNQNAVDPLQPRVDADTQSRIQALAQARTGAQVVVSVKNPSYQKIKLDFKVHFRTGNPFNQYRDILQTALIQALSPWAFDVDREITFGGAVYKSVLLNFVEELSYVDYVTDFVMHSYVGTTVDTADVSEARPATPDAILVSDATHTIGEAL